MKSSEVVLISPAELAELLGSARPPVLADVRWTVGGPPGKPDFEASHIPGAVWVDLETQLAGPPGIGGRHPLPTVSVFELAMREIGPGLLFWSCRRDLGWWIVAVNQLGSVLFMVSAVASFVHRGGDMIAVDIANWGTLTGALSTRAAAAGAGNRSCPRPVH